MKIVKCDVCGNTAVLIENGKGAMVCCGKPMRELIPQVSDEGSEKHVPVTEEGRCLTTVKVGSVPHPMSDLHHVAWIALETEDGFSLRYLSPDMDPEAVFLADSKCVKTYEYCNIHGLWSSFLAIE